MAILGAMAATGYQENIEWKFGRLGSCRRDVEVGQRGGV